MMNSVQFIGSLLCVVSCVSCVEIGTHDYCRIRSEDRDIQFLKESVMYVFEVEIYNQSTDPLKTDISRTYKPWKWYRTTAEHGKTLLTLSFNYDVLSLSILTIGVEKVSLKIVDNPEGCFKNLTAEERVEILRDKVFDNFKRKRTMKTVAELMEIENTEETPEMIYVCNEVVQENKGFAEFANQCCARDSSGVITCSGQEDNVWITVLYICIGLVKLMLFMFCPFMVPTNMYTASYVASEYVVKLSKALKLKAFISESAVTSVRYKYRLTTENISDWHRFKHCLEKLPKDEICDVVVPELRIKIKGKRIIPANEPPTGLLRTFYDNLIRCKIRRLEPFRDCCNRSIYASLQPFVKHECHWEHLVLIFIKVVCLLIVPAPFYIRVFIYFRFEELELSSRRFMVNQLGLQQAFNPFRMNFVQYLTPTHGLFISAYAFYILAGVVIGFSKDYVRDTLKSIVRSAFHDMENVSRTKVLQVVMRFLLWPFRHLGLVALLTCPIISILTAPLWATLFVIYAVPTFYLAHRLVFHVQKKLGSDNSIFESDKPLGTAKKHAYELHKKLTKIDKGVHNARKRFIDEEKQSPCMAGYGRLVALRRLAIQILASLFCVAVLFSCVLLFVEAIGVMVEVLVFTMMGIIVNAGSTLKYVSMALLVIVYMHNCYDNVYDNYLEFNYSILDDIMERVEDLKKVASLPSSVQENVAFQVKPVEAVNEIQTTLNIEKREPMWRIGHLLLFLDSYDTPRIPLNLFKKLCEIRVHGAPGPVYINLLKATGKFSIILVFLFFVMIVVMAFGSAHQMSSTNQTLATLAGGFVPMLLKNVLSTKGTKLNLRTLSFKGQIDEIVSEYKQNWPISDFIIEKCDPLDDKEKGNEKQEEPQKEESKLTDCIQKYKCRGDENENSVGVKSYISSEEDNNPISIAEDTTVSDPFKDSLEDLRSHESDGLLKLVSQIDDNFADIFIDLSVEETVSPWQWLYGSNESLGKSDVSETMFNEVKTETYDLRMPYPTIVTYNNGIYAT